MKTDYYCAECNSQFSEPRIPNINKIHYCGKAARVIEFFGDSAEVSLVDTEEKHH